MSNYKAEIMLAVVGLVFFSIIAFFATDVFDPLLGDIGRGLKEKVSSVFTGLP